MVATLKFVLNGRVTTVTAEPGARMTRVLREHLGLTGTKVGCDAGDCGACTVLMDGRAVCACMVPAARLEGSVVTTIEGLSNGNGGMLNALQKSFLHYGAAQCGICTPGMLISATDLLNRIPQPDEQEVEDALGGVLCRCTGYRKIVQAVMQAHAFSDLEKTAERKRAVGASVIRVDGIAKVIGTDVFGADEAPGNALWVRVIRSPYHRAQFTFGDIEDFTASRDGIVRVLTAADIPGENRFGVIPDYADQPVFAEQETRFRGEAVAAVVGEQQAMSELNLDDFPVSWTELPAVLTPAEAQADGAPPLHANRKRNRLIGGLVRRGGLEAEFAAADKVASGEFETKFIEHAYIEPEAGYARPEGDKIAVHACTQAPYMDRHDLAGILGLEPEDVRIIPSSVGGGFGSKLDISLQPYVALAALVLDRPARIVYTRSESMISTTKRHPSFIRATVGARSDGKLTAMKFEGVFNTGAYASWGPTVAVRVPVHASGPYYFPAYEAHSLAVHTHSTPAGAFRGFGVPQSAVAQEALFDDLADMLGMDRLQFRIINALENGMQTGTGQVFETGVGFRKCLLALQPHWDSEYRSAELFNRKSDGALRRGIGVAGVWYGCGNTSLPNPSTIKVGIKQDGALLLYQGAVDIGQGSNTVITQICADALGMDLDLFSLVPGDTAQTPDAGKTSASRQTFVSGKAAYLAGTGLRKQILDRVKASDDAELTIEDGYLKVSDSGIQEIYFLPEMPADEDGFVFLSEGSYDPPTRPLDKNGQGDPYATYGFGAQVAVVEVDVSLGTVKVVKFFAAHDVGRAINPVLVEGQVEGGVAQGIGMALMEEYIPGGTENLHDYLIPTIGDVPDIKTIIVEENDPHGPYGAKGLGEHVLIPTAPAILNAINHATGAKVRILPATPERVLSALREAGK